MSFITKRERVFNEYDLFELPARNEGKLKAFASCTDTRAWSHFNSDKTEHLVDIIKRNNDRCAPKYVPTTVIVDTLMFTKNNEIGRLKRKIETLEQMLAVYDELNLDCTQKCDIAKAHEAIKAANKELDEMFLDLDLSGFTEGMSDSEIFETGKSRGDVTEKSRQKEIGYGNSTPRVDSKGIQLSQMQMDTCTCEASTLATDPRIDEMQDDIISKDAKLSAMQNTIAVMENDVCEPYCIYAHIFTALEKIFGILNQNEKYKEYLDLLTAGKDTRCIDIKGKILYKMKVLEKFCLALIAPCSQDFNRSQSTTDCACYYAALVARVETTFALTSAEAGQPTSLDNKRAQLVAEIMDNDEMKEILSKESCVVTDGELTDEELGVENYNIETENLNRLKDLQKSYDELILCYENLKHERDCLQVRCRKYNELEAELEDLQCQVRAYSVLWNEKEHYRKRSEDLDNLKEKFVVLCDEASELETQLKTESEKNYNKTKMIDELRNNSVQLERKLNEAYISFERDKTALQCKLKETECKCMCQDQQIKQLTVQLDRHMEKSQDKELSESANSIGLLSEIESLKDQTKTLKDLLFCSEEEKSHLQNQFDDKLNLINDLKIEIEHWKSSYEKIYNHNLYLEKCAENLSSLEAENKDLLESVEDKNKAVNNLMSVIKDKSLEMKRLQDEVERKYQENNELINQLNNKQTTYSSQIDSLENERLNILKQLNLEKKASKELLERLTDNDTERSNDDEALKMKSHSYDQLKEELLKITEKNETLRSENDKLENNNYLLAQEIQRLHEKYDSLKHELTTRENERDSALSNHELIKNSFENLSEELTNLRKNYSELDKEKTKLESALDDKSMQLDDAISSIQLSQQQSCELLDKIKNSDNLKQDLIELNTTYKNLAKEKYILKNNLSDKCKNIENLTQELKKLKQSNCELLDSSKKALALEKKVELLRITNEDLQRTIRILQNDTSEKLSNNNDLVQKLDLKDHENKQLLLELEEVRVKNLDLTRNINVQEEKCKDLLKKLQYYDHLADNFDELHRNFNQIQMQNNMLQKEMDHKITLEQDMRGLQEQMQNIYEHNQELEDIIMRVRSKSTEQNELPDFDFDYIKEEMDKLKQEKITSSNKIRELLNKLDENENTISNLDQHLLARDDRIVVLENQINNLEDEIRFLHQSLEEGLNTGEEIVNKGFPEIDKSLKQMEAHHSKATHNMKAELAKLEKDKALLEEDLSTTKLRNEDKVTEHKLVAQIKQLRNERDVIVSEIKQLEMSSIGDSDLSPNHCDVEHVVESIDRVRRSFETRNSQNNTLEQTLFKMQSSSQLVLSKADEAKKIAENEKEKIINEKEDAVRQRLYLEQKMAELREQLKRQVTNDEKVIKDLEAEIQNQILIINKINESSQSYTSKLQEEITTLQDLYKNSQAKIENLQSKLQTITDENKNYSDIVDKIKLSLKEKSIEIKKLQNELQDVKSQGYTIEKTIKGNLNEKTSADKYSQTEIEQSNKMKSSETYIEMSKYISVPHSNKNIENVGGTKIKNHSENKVKYITSPNAAPDVNEVQILTANIEPNIDLVKNIYQSYKINKLSPGPLQLNSITSLNDEEDSSENANYEISQTKYILEDVNSPSLINIYSHNDINHSADSHKIFDDKSVIPQQRKEKNYINNNNQPLAERKSIQHFARDDAFRPNVSNKTEQSRLITEFQSENDGSDNDSHSKKSREAISVIASTSEETTTDKDFFVIFRDSNSSNRKHESLRNNATHIKNDTKSIKNNIDEIHDRNDKKDNMRQTQTKQITSDKFDDSKTKSNKIDKEKSGNEGKKGVLKINMPRVNNENQSLLSSTSDCEKKSIDLYAVVVKPYPKSEHKTRSDIDISEKHISDATKTPSLPSLSNDHYYQKSLTSVDMVSDEETIKKILNKQLSDTDDEKLKQKENALKSNKSSLKTEDETSDTAENTYEHTSEDSRDKQESHHKLARVNAEVRIHKSTKKDVDGARHPKRSDFGLEYIMDSVRQENYPHTIKPFVDIPQLEKTISDERLIVPLAKYDDINKNTDRKQIKDTLPLSEHETLSKSSQTNILKSYDHKSMINKSVSANMDSTEHYERRIQTLNQTIDSIDKDYKTKLEAIKAQYDTNINQIICEHNHGVKSIQNLHEETLQDIMKTHESEVENLRGMSMEAMRKAEILTKVNQDLMHKMGTNDSLDGLDKEPVKISGSEERKCRTRSRGTKTLSKTSVESFNVKPKVRPSGPCTCSLDANISDTIRNIFDQVDVEQRKMAEHAYMKYIANKMLTGNVENLDSQELAFLHCKVCRSWKSKLSKEEALQKRIDALETDLMSSQRNAQLQMEELDRKVAEERRRLQEVREAVCSSTPAASREVSPQPRPAPRRRRPDDEKEVGCGCNMGRPCRSNNLERRSAGDLTVSVAPPARPKRPKTENHRAVLAKPATEDRRGDRRLYSDEQPTRLRKAPERAAARAHKK